MYLTLEVVSPQAASLGADRRRIVSQRGLTIGRVPGNDWVIPDPYISKQHARITYANGTFFVESLGRNAIAIGTANNALPGKQPQPLRNGDHLFIDQYEIIVTTMQGDPPGSAAPAIGMASDDPFAVLPAGTSAGSLAGASPSGSPSGLIPDVWDGSPAAGLADTGVLDPLAALGAGARANAPEPLPPVNWQQGSPLEDHFQPPPVNTPAGGSPFDLLESASPAPPPAAPAAGIPDNWDRTHLTHIEAPRTPAPQAVPLNRPAPRPAAPVPSVRPGNREAPGAKGSPADLLARQPAARPAVAPAPAPAPAGVRTENTPRMPPPAAEPPRSAPAYEAPRAPAPARQAPNPAALSVAVGAELADLLRGAGLSEQDLSPEMMRDLGRVLRVVVEGVMDVLRARSEIKSQFRLPLTRIQSAENNPLKHSPNVESALHTLLVQRNPGFLGTVQAFEDAFDDIRNHQMAMLEGVRVAFESMFESFDPKELEKEFEGTAKRGGLFGGGKARFWELYVERYSRLTGDADDTFRRLFGDVFAEAYEKQLERLKTIGRNTGRT
ncbi:MAG TPA: type VI secretion system-associated FHA domain protein TagH [Steroidobacteraceae bacterium]|nr:type VI secretion system-associated FHA domain protein TagH [Steroidobacteraceae bacterium]